MISSYCVQIFMINMVHLRNKYFVFRVWDARTGEMLNTLIHHCEAVLHLRFCDGIMVTCSKVRTGY